MSSDSESDEEVVVKSSAFAMLDSDSDSDDSDEERLKAERKAAKKKVRSCGGSVRTRLTEVLILISSRPPRSPRD